MVVFTCTHCGDSLQKPKVEKHYQTVCRTIKSLTCVDCLKDFREEEYASHIKCVTEEERYAAKDGNQKQVVKKGEVKQESWTELIKTVVENAKNVPGAQKRVLDVMANSVNVPRKKNKFINFVKSSTGGRLKNEDIEAVWGMIEQHKGIQTENAEANTNDTSLKVEDENEQLGGKKKSKSKQAKEVDQPTETNEDVTEHTTKSKKKKHKSKHSEDHDHLNTEIKVKRKVEDDGLNDQVAEGKKRKTNKVEPVATTEINEDAVQIEGKSKKKKKSKHMNENGEANDIAKTEIPITNQDEATNEQIVELKKKRKSKEIPEPIDTTETNGNTVQLVEGESKKKRKTKGVSENIDTNIIITTTEITNMNGKAEATADGKHKSKAECKLATIDETTLQGEGKSKKKKRKSKNSDETINDESINGHITKCKKKHKSKEVVEAIATTEINEDSIQLTDGKLKKKKHKSKMSGEANC